jgi:hypothetical protein
MVSVSPSSSFSSSPASTSFRDDILKRCEVVQVTTQTQQNNVIQTYLYCHCTYMQIQWSAVSRLIQIKVIVTFLIIFLILFLFCNFIVIPPNNTHRYSYDNPTMMATTTTTTPFTASLVATTKLEASDQLDTEVVIVLHSCNMTKYSSKFDPIIGTTSNKKDWINMTNPKKYHTLYNNNNSDHNLHPTNLQYGYTNQDEMSRKVERFPLIDECVQVYMSIWYYPPLLFNDDVNSIGGRRNGKISMDSNPPIVQYS